ncbi:MAG: DNA-processing protein DprA [Candidatus Sungiibacteriota bacterium]
MDVEEIKFLNAFNTIPHVGAASLRTLRNHFGSFASAWKAHTHAYNIIGIDAPARDAIAACKKTIDPDSSMQKLVRDSIWIIADDDPAFPPMLKEISYPPIMLYGCGDKNILAPTYPIAIVGTRRPTPYGLEAVEHIVEKLVAASITIVSGLAMGIDAKAHAVTLKHRGTTIAVLGCGVDQNTIFPPENRGLAQHIVENGGAVISEYAPETPGVKEHFPMRNRIIAGLSRGTLVVEAREKSGALITARQALEENRDVFAVPGSIFSPTSIGPNRLIQQGAKAILDGGDVLEELGIDESSAIRHHAVLALTDEEASVVNILVENATIDTLREKTKLATGTLLSLLSVLELKGIVRNLGADTFQKI